MAELLAPAGDWQTLRRAVHCGADAVYLGATGFNARAKAQNFNGEDLQKAVSFCRLYGVKAYVAFNIFILQKEMPAAKKALIEIERTKPDGIIIADIGLIPLLQEVAPKLPVHISTQAGVHNLLSARFFQNLGADRVILARETLKSDILAIRNHTNLDLEYFVHGALCSSFSGRCLLSWAFQNGSGNRGTCGQPCRLYGEISSHSNKKSGHVLSAADLCLANRLKELSDLGINSFKIEGRLRRSAYTAAAVYSYRRILDGNSSPQAELPLLKRAYNRGNFSEGYLFSDNNALFSADVQSHLGEQCGTVLSVFVKKGFSFAKVQSDIPLTAGDGLKLLRGGKECGGADVTSCKDLGGRVYEIPISGGARAGDVLCLTTDKSENDRLNAITRPLTVDIAVTARVGEPLGLTLSHGGISVFMQSNERVTHAKTAPLQESELAKRVSKQEDFGFFTGKVSVNADEDIFLPVSVINELKRRGYGALKEEVQIKRERQARKNTPCGNLTEAQKSPQKTGVFQGDFWTDQGRVCEAGNVPCPPTDFSTYGAVILKPCSYDGAAIKSLLANVRKTAKKEAKLYLAFPALLRGADETFLKDFFNLLSEEKLGVYASQFAAVQFARDYRIPYAAGYELNVMNENAMLLLSDADFALLSKELSPENLLPLLQKGGVFAPYPYMDAMTLAYCPVKFLFGKTCADCSYKTPLVYTLGKKRFLVYRTQPERNLQEGGRKVRSRTCYFTAYAV